MRRLDGKTDSMDMSLSKLQEMVKGKPGMLQFMGRKKLDMTEQLIWSDLNGTRYHLLGCLNTEFQANFFTLSPS